MKMLSGIVIGIILTLVAMGAIGYTVIVNGWVPARMDEAPSALEKWAAKTSLHATLKREATETSPIPANEETLMAGAKIYSSNCSGCHGTPTEKTPAFSKGMTPGPTLFGDGDLVADDPEGSIYWKVEHGVRFTAMPSFKPILSNNEIWQVTLFLKHMDKLPPSVEKYWNTME